MSKIGMIVVGLFAMVAGSAGLDMLISGRSGAWRLLISSAGMVILLSSYFMHGDKPRTFSTLALQNFPQPAVLVASRRRSLALGVAALCLFLAFVDVARIGNAEAGYTIFVALLSVLFGIPGGVLIAASVKPNLLSLGRQSLVSWSLVGSKEWRWEDVSDFRAIATVNRGKRQVHVKRHIGFNDCSANGTRKGIKLCRLTGSNATLNNSFSLPDEELAAVLNEWRARAVAQGR